MAASSPQHTDFSVDFLGRYVCNGLDEALRSMDRNARRPNGSSQEDARPFDVIVIGGGSFGPIFAQHLLYGDKTRRHRILVLEGGRFTLPEHIQNLPLMQADLPVWNTPWLSNPAADLRYKGLAWCVGGRSLFFGGWSPPLIDAELAAWPVAVRTALRERYYKAAADLIGTSESNDFIDGPLHRAMRDQLYEGLSGNRMPELVPWEEVPLLMPLRRSASAETAKRLKLEAPLAVQSRAPKGLFPINKFSAVPLTIKAARLAWADSQGDDVHKRFMIVPDCIVRRLATTRQDGVTVVTEVQTNKGTVPVPPGGVVILALGTIESARLARVSFPDVPSARHIGQNLMAHLRSNLHLRIDRTNLTKLSDSLDQLGVSALFVRGRHKDSQDGTLGHYHFQITASGLGPGGLDAEEELFKKVPDAEFLEVLKQTTDSKVVITIRGIGEMRPNNPKSFVGPSGQNDSFGVEKAFVAIEPTRQDLELWDAMDAAAAQLAEIFHGGPGYEVLGEHRDRLGTTHHEAGTLAMGAPGQSVLDDNCRFHDVPNAYVAGPASFPTVGSPNPMLTGSALARRLADHLVEALPRHRPVADAGFQLLFDGVDARGWRMTTIKNQPTRDDPGSAFIVDGALELRPGTDLGLLWCTEPITSDFQLKLEWRVWRQDANSGVFFGFPDPQAFTSYRNTAWVAIHKGFEVQIDDLARPDGAPVQKTAAVYGFAGPANPNALPLNPVGEWNTFVIGVRGVGSKRLKVDVSLNPDRHPSPVTLFEYAIGQDTSHPDRGRVTPTFVGLQTHTGRVAFRNIQIRKAA